MRRVVVLCVFAVLSGLAAPHGAAQEHHAAADGPRVIVLHDAPADGRVVVGQPAHFGFALVTPEGGLQVHTDHRVVVTQEGRVVVETRDAHEYDGLFGMDVTFDRAGPYEVLVQATDGDTVLSEATFAGTVVVAPLAPVTIELAPAAEPRVGNPLDVEVRVLDAAGGAVPHSDALVEIRRLPDGFLTLRAHLHAHEDAMTFTYAFPTPGDYEAMVTAWNAYPEAGAPDFAAVATFPIAVGAGAPSPHRDPAPPSEAAPDAGAFTLIAAIDPTPVAGQSIVGPTTQVRLSAFALDAAAMRATEHVNYDASVFGPAGVVFRSGSLHEYDGHLELVLNGLAPGDHVFGATAQSGESSATTVLAFRVVPPAVPLSAGPYVVALAAASPAPGEPVELVFAARNAAGLPFDHTELDLTFLPPGDAAPPLAQLKVHTHGSGEYRATVAFPTEGAWRVLVDPTPLEPRPAVVFGPDGPGRPIVFEIPVAGAIPLDGAPAAAAGGDSAATSIPAPALPLALAVALALALVRAKRS